jgi:5-methylcytosine-specific restriction endonuclease McrA
MSGKVRQGTAQPKGCWIRKEKRLALYIRDRFTCQYCGKDLIAVNSSDITLDHLTPRSEGGNNEATNLITACKSCNCGRQAKAYYEYATQGAIERIEAQRYAVLNIDLAIDIIRGYVSKAESR